LNEDPVIKQLRYILQLLDDCLEKMDDVLRPRARNVFWRAFFPAGEFMTQKSHARKAAAILIDIDSRLRDMVEVLYGQDSNLAAKLEDFRQLNLIEMSERLIEIPERVQYMDDQITSLRERVLKLITQLENRN
jgi:hypothetical protein